MSIVKAKKAQIVPTKKPAATFEQSNQKAYLANKPQAYNVEFKSREVSIPNHSSYPCVPWNKLIRYFSCPRIGVHTNTTAIALNSGKCQRISNSSYEHSQEGQQIQH